MKGFSEKMNNFQAGDSEIRILDTVNDIMNWFRVNSVQRD